MILLKSEIGLPQQVVASVKAALDYVPDPEHTSIGVITYNNTTQFFTFASESSAEPSVVAMGDIVAPFCPLPRGRLLFNVKTARDRIELLLDRVLTMHSGAAAGAKSMHFGSAGSCAGSAVRAAVDALKSGCGKVLWFCADMPSLGVGALQSRNNPKLYGTEKERTLLLPTDVYQDLADVCANQKVAVDIFVCTHGDIDLASLLPVSAGVGGEVYYYPDFNAASYVGAMNLGDRQGEKLHFDVFRDLTRYTVYDVSMKARCSIGLRVAKYLGGLGETSENTVELATLDADKTIGFLLEQESKLKTESAAYLQFAVLYTTPAGERKIRVFNYKLTVTDQASILLQNHGDRSNVSEH